MSFLRLLVTISVMNVTDKKNEKPMPPSSHGWITSTSLAPPSYRCLVRVPHSKTKPHDQWLFCFPTVFVFVFCLPLTRRWLAKKHRRAQQTKQCGRLTVTGHHFAQVNLPFDLQSRQNDHDDTNHEDEQQQAFVFLNFVALLFNPPLDFRKF